MSENTFDFAVIGGGPGGYVAAIKGAQLGLKTALVEKSAHLGGTCLNVGCIPSKALLHSTELYQFTAKESQLHGIECKGLSMNLATLMKRKEAVVSRLRMGVRSLVEKRGITIFAGLGRLLGDGVVEIEGASESSRDQGRKHRCGYWVECRVAAIFALRRRSDRDQRRGHCIHRST